jgi:dipeptidyl aminopeptidase/acylaminoacyl peptidase
MFSLASLVLLSFAAPPVAPPLEKWTIDDVVLAETAGDFQISPDGRAAVWVRTSANKEHNDHIGHIYRTDLVSGRTVRLTRGNEPCIHPRWSPDGKSIAFLSSRPIPGAKVSEEKATEEPKLQIWLIDPTGGEAWSLTDQPRGVVTFDWAGAKAIVFTAQEDPTTRETKIKDEDKDTTVVVEEEKHEPPVRLFRIEIEEKKVKRLTINSDRIEGLAVSPDGRWAVATHARSLCYTYNNKVKPIHFLHDLKTGKATRVFVNPKWNISAIRWSPNGQELYATNEHSSRPELAQAGLSELLYHDRSSGIEGRVDLDWPRGLAGQHENDHAPGFVPVRDGFLALLADGVRNRAARYTRKEAGGFKREWLSGAHVGQLFGLQASQDGAALLYARSAANLPTRWYRARLWQNRIDKPEPLPALNESFNQRRRARTEIVRWKGGNGEEVEGILYYPHGHVAGKRYPLVVMIHGGPASHDIDCWNENWGYAPNLLCQRGAFVLRPNYHGSTGYGLTWMESIANGKYVGVELDDIEKGVDALIARGLVDSAKLGLQGWSNGAILTNALVTRTTRYKAASAGAGTVEYVSDWASCEFGEAFNRYYLNASPFDDLALYQRKSPFHRFDKVRTPSLIFFGTEDRVVHPQQGWLHFRGLQQLGKTPVRFVQFPGEKHSLKKIGHQSRKLREELAWFDKYLFGPSKPQNDALKSDSPLAWALKRQAAKRDGSRFGLLEKDRLIPETVRYEGIQIGRFEITAAQFADFDRAVAPTFGRENYPAAGVTFERAEAYCAWLSKLTGRKYRLPNEEEAEKLYAEAATGDNTLDHWAGYAVNPEDAAKLRAAAKALPGSAPLLRPVGQGRGVGKEELVYDLGGNAAEWVKGKDGKGLLRGGSADQPADAKGGPRPADTAYRGFRVVEER